MTQAYMSGSFNSAKPVSIMFFVIDSTLTRLVDTAEITDDKVKKVLESTTSFVPPSNTLTKYNDTFIEKNKSTPQHLLSGLRARQSLSSSTAAQNQKDVFNILGLKSVEITDASDTIELLREWKADEDKINDFRNKAHKKWPDATVFADDSS
jgi:hypothetical protein